MGGRGLTAADLRLSTEFAIVNAISIEDEAK
jgi:hypothetical protein